MLYESAVLRLKQDDCIKHYFCEKMRYAVVVCDFTVYLHNEILRNLGRSELNGFSVENYRITPTISRD